MNYLLSVLCYDDRQDIHIQFKYIHTYIYISIYIYIKKSRCFYSTFFPRKDVIIWFRVSSLAHMSCVWRHTDRKNQGWWRCAQTPQLKQINLLWTLTNWMWLYIYIYIYPPTHKHNLLWIGKQNTISRLIYLLMCYIVECIWEAFFPYYVPEQVPMWLFFLCRDDKLTNNSCLLVCFLV